MGAAFLYLHPYIFQNLFCSNSCVHTVDSSLVQSHASLPTQRFTHAKVLYSHWNSRCLCGFVRFWPNADRFTHINNRRRNCRRMHRKWWMMNGWVAAFEYTRISFMPCLGGGCQSLYWSRIWGCGRAHEPAKQVGETWFMFAQFTLTKEDAKRYLYQSSTKRRVHNWDDITVRLFIWYSDPPVEKSTGGFLRKPRKAQRKTKYLA